MSDNPYRGEFSAWRDVVSAFGEGSPGLPWGRADKTIAGAPEQEPEQVFLASYVEENYEGNAIVIYRQGNRVFEVTGIHCSCYGFEGQWQPEEYDIPTYIAALERRDPDEDERDVIAELRAML